MGFCFVGCFSIYGPLSVRRSRGDSLTVQCHYDPGWETYHKWWCRGEAWGSCEILVKTAGSEQKVRSGRVSIQDHHWRNTFTVTIEELQESDTDAYWCGIERSGTDLGHQMHVVVDPGRSRPLLAVGNAAASLCLPHRRRGARRLHMCMCICVGTHVCALGGSSKSLGGLEEKANLSTIGGLLPGPLSLRG